LPPPDTPTDDAALLKLLEPYLGWFLAEIDTRSLDILICDADLTANGHPQHLVLLTGRAVGLWLRNANSHVNTSNYDNKHPE
jgi:hypothetical protein